MGQSTDDKAIADSKVKFGRYEEYAYDEDDISVSLYYIEFVLKITNKSEEPIPTLIVDNRSKYLSFLINGKENNPISLYNGMTANNAALFIQKNESDSYSINWILTPDCGLTEKYGNIFTVQWKYLNHLSQIIEVDIKHHSSKTLIK